jgi:Protein phosphatase 2C
VWRPIAQSILGPSHATDNCPCQDSHSLRIAGERSTPTLIACVADGAGSAAHSDVGSRIVCDTVMDCAAAFVAAGGRLDHLQRTDVIRWCEDARQRVQQEATARNCEVRELASTLCAAIIAPGHCCFFQIGDGAMIIRRHGVYGVVFWPQTGEYANSTNFLTSNLFESQLEFASFESGCSDVALMTDGLERLALRFDSQTPHVPFFEPFFRAIRASENYTGLNESLQAFLASQPVRERSDDDKTLILASFVDEPTENAV